MLDTRPTGAPTAALSIRGLRKAYGSVVAVDGIDLDVMRGECFGFLGPNGAGKTTTLEICEGLLEADSGQVELLGHTWRSHARVLRQRIGIQLQETQLSQKLTVEETLSLFRSFYHQGPSVGEVIELVQLSEKRRARIGSLSGGQVQRLSLACALVGEPEFLFLDEPTTGLDPQSRRQLWELIERFRATGRTILLTTHYMDEAERLCDRVAIVDHGRVIALDTPKALIGSLGAEHLVEFSLEDGQSIDDETLTALDGVTVCRRDNGAYSLQVSAIHRTLPALLTELRRREKTLADLRTHSATLEDVFVALTGRRLR